MYQYPQLQSLAEPCKAICMRRCKLQKESRIAGRWVHWITPTLLTTPDHLSKGSITRSSQSHAVYSLTYCQNQCWQICPGSRLLVAPINCTFACRRPTKILNWYAAPGGVVEYASLIPYPVVQMCSSRGYVLGSDRSLRPICPIWRSGEV